MFPFYPARLRHTRPRTRAVHVHCTSIPSSNVNNPKRRNRAETHWNWNKPRSRPTPISSMDRTLFRVIVPTRFLLIVTLFRPCECPPHSLPASGSALFLLRLAGLHLGTDVPARPYSHADIPFKFPHRNSGVPPIGRVACSVTILFFSRSMNAVVRTENQ